MKMSATSIVVGALALASSAVYSSTTVYTSETPFLSALAPAPLWTNTFTFPQPFGGSLFGSTQGGVSYTIAGPSGDWANGDIMGNWAANESLTISFVSGNTFAVGGDFFITNALFVFSNTRPVTLTLDDGTTTTYTPADVASSFRGFISTSPIATLTMSAAGLDGFNQLDNLTVPAVAAAPEPSAWLFLVVGIGAVSAASRRSKPKLPT
jgi:hypothetical protein